MNNPLVYNRNITHRSGNLLQSVTDEQARQWAREKWDGKVIGHSWHPAYIAACEELRKSSMRESQLKIVEQWPEWKKNVKLTKYS